MRYRGDRTIDLETMRGKDEIVADWLPRYTGTPLTEFGKYILLVNPHMHLRIGIDSLCQLINQGLTVKHLRF
jgi:hypothetical protein